MTKRLAQNAKAAFWLPAFPAPFFRNPHEASRKISLFFISAVRLADSHKIEDFGSLAIRHHLWEFSIGNEEPPWGEMNDFSVNA